MLGLVSNLLDGGTSKPKEQAETLAGGDEPGDKKYTSHDKRELCNDSTSSTMDVAKQWGSYLYGFGLSASSSVANKAMDLKSSIEQKGIFGDFTREQEQFITEKREQKMRSEAALPPWVGYNEEEEMKTQILALSQDKRNFLRNPPSGVDFQFDFDTSYPIAMATLQEDDSLRSMRFELVPKKIKECDFWRNYFYRVSLIKQSSQVASMARQTSSMAGGRKEVSVSDEAAGESVTLEGTSPLQSEFVSDSFQDTLPISSRLPTATDTLVTSGTTSSTADVSTGVAPSNHTTVSSTNTSRDKKQAEESLSPTGAAAEPQQQDLSSWERELAHELNEFELVEGGADATTDAEYAELEDEILREINAATDNDRAAASSATCASVKESKYGDSKGD